LAVLERLFAEEKDICIGVGGVKTPPYILSKTCG